MSLSSAVDLRNIRVWDPRSRHLQPSATGLRISFKASWLAGSKVGQAWPLHLRMLNTVVNRVCRAWGCSKGLLKDFQAPQVGHTILSLMAVLNSSLLPAPLQA